MDDCVAAVAVAVAAYRRCKPRIKNIDQLALVLGLLDDEGVIVSRERTCILFCNVGRTSSVVIRYCWRPLAHHCYLHGT